MTSKLIPAKPDEVMVIRKLTENIVTMSAPFNRFGRARIGGRGTVVKLPSGALAVFSPIALTAPVKTEIASLGGAVKYIAALDMEHHIFLGDWHKEFPQAKVLAPEGLFEKREKQGNEKVQIDVTYTGKDQASGQMPSVDEEFDKEFDVEYVAGHVNKEIAFNFKRDRTLIEADLLWNLPALDQYSRSSENPHQGLLTRFFNAIQGTSGSALTGQRRFVWYIASSGNRKAFNQSIGRINNWDFERVIPCHGDVLETGGKGIFRKVFQWHLQVLEKEAAK